MLIPAGSLLYAYLFKAHDSFYKWGELVDYILLIGLVQIITNWGMKDITLRAIAKSPSQVSTLFTENFLARLVLVLGGVVFIFLIYPLKLSPILSIWLIGAFLLASVDCLSLYYKKLSFFALMELISIAGISIFISMNPLVDGFSLIQLFAFIALSKGILAVLYFRKSFTFKKVKVSLVTLGTSLPIFLIGLFGMLHSKIDLYLVNWMLNDNDTAQYQVIITGLIYIQALAGLYLLPHQKNLFRLNKKSILKLSLTSLIIGVVVSVIAIPLIAWGLIRFFDIKYSTTDIVYMVIYLLPIYFCLPIIYYTYSLKKETWVLVINVTGALINSIIAYVLIPSLNYSGALIAAASGQVVMLLGYILIFTNTSKNESSKSNS